MNSDLVTGTLTQSMIRSLGMPEQFLAMGGCPHFGTEQCTTCPLAVHIPCQLCDPPDECPACPRRRDCPCGCAERRQELQAELGVSFAEPAEIVGDDGDLCMVPAVCRHADISDYTVYKLLKEGRLTGLRRYIPGTRRLAWYVSVAEMAYYAALGITERKRLSKVQKWTVRELME